MVIDTNVLVSALINEHGWEAAVLFAVDSGVLQWCVSPALLAEYKAVLSRPEFSAIPTGLVTALLQKAAAAESVYPTATMHISPDELDNRFYECANAAGADYIVTGNLKDFPEDLPPTKVVSARQLLKRLHS